MRTHRRAVLSIAHLVYVPYVLDEMGVPTDSWTRLPEPLMAYEFEPVSATEPVMHGHNRVIQTAKVYAPLNSRVRARDRLELADKLYEVVGDPQQWQNRHSGYTAGEVINLRLIEG